MNDRIEKGKQVTKEAITNNDAEALQKCLRTFLDMKASPQDIYDAIQACPISLLNATGYTLTIFSDLVGRNVTFGKDISWEAVRGYLKVGADREAVKVALDAQNLFGGEIESVEKGDNLPLFTDGGETNEN